MIDVGRIQESLRKHHIDGWLLYDFRGLNAIARDVLHFPDTILTRRWFYLIPKEGRPVGIGHTLEPDAIAHLPGQRLMYHDRQTLASHLNQAVGRLKSVAMEYSPNGALPTVSRVDRGTIEWIESLGPRVVPSAALIQDFLAVLTADQVASHRRAAARVLKIKNEAFARARDIVGRGGSLSEYDLQQFILKRIVDDGLFTDHPPIVAVNAHAGRPHYEPTADHCSPIRKGDLLLIDLWGREPRGVFADITWTGFLGAEVPDRIARVFAVVAEARDAALAAIGDAYAQGRVITGAEADRAARRVIIEAGWGEQFIHRTGHSITSELHGSGANLDDYETEDTRPLVVGLLFSIEPGIYLGEFGIRSEINVLTTPDGPEVTTLPLQTEVLPLLAT
jgi:Xaa-Pro aminopeptidase